MASDGYSASTRRVRIQVIRAICNYSHVQPEELRSYHVREYFLARPLAVWSRLAYLNHLRALSAWTGGPDPTEGLRRPPSPRLLPDPLSEEHLSRLLQHLDGMERVWALLGAYAGLRRHEVAKLHPDDFAGGSLRVLGKGGRLDVLPIAPVLAAALRPYSGLDGPCWPDATPILVSARIKRAAAELGIRMHFHQLRHRFGTAVYAATHDLLLTQRLMRHCSPQTTAGYAAVAEARSPQVVASLPGADDPPLQE